jgi:molybdate transport system ATP-binding protein
MLHARFLHAYPGFALDVDLNLPMRGVTALFGPSGSGKTTLLRLLAGLERAAEGRVHVGDVVWQDATHFLPAHRRPIGYVFQDARLFPHLTVRQNLAYGLRRAGSAEDLQAMAARLGIEPLLDRKPLRLSGGEAQRVAIARALLTQPRVLLMDEPLAALDAARRAEILPYLERLHVEAEIPVIYVSHSFDEVARLADHLVLLDAGRVIAAGALHELTARLDLPLAQAAEAEAVIEARVVAHDPEFHLTRLAFAGGELQLPYHAAAMGQAVRVGIRARDVSITLEAQQGTSILNILPATIVAMAAAGPAQVVLRLQVGEAFLLARVTRKSAQTLGLTLGRSVFAQIKSVAIVE